MGCLVKIFTYVACNNALTKDAQEEIGRQRH